MASRTEVDKVIRNGTVFPGWDAALNHAVDVTTRQTSIAIANTWYDLECELTDISLQDFTNGANAVYNYNGTGDRFNMFANIRFKHTAPNASIDVVWSINGVPCACGPMGTIAKTAGEGYFVFVIGVPDLVNGDTAKVQVRSDTTGTVEVLDMQCIGGVK